MSKEETAPDPGSIDEGPQNDREVPSISVLQRELLEASGLSRSKLTSCGLDWRELGAIYEDHISRLPDLEDAANFIASKLRRLSVVHSVRTRIKDPGHLIEKIVRKRNEDPDRDINFSNYREKLTDLVGVRALHLVKEEWRTIHDFVDDTWKFAEKPTAYHRTGDHPDWLAAFEDAGCDVKPHPRRYRSVHYLVEVPGGRTTTIAELQVRTLFEEAWSELDHRINYPQSVPFPRVGFFLEIFNRLAGSADEMGSFILALLSDLGALSEEVEKANDQQREAMEKVEELMMKLKLSATQRRELRSELELLRGSTRHDSFAVNTSPDYLTTGLPSGLVVGGASAGAFSGTTNLWNVTSNRRCSNCSYEDANDPGVITVGGWQCPMCGVGVMR